MVSTLTRAPAVPVRRRWRPLAPVNWALLILFVLFTTVVGVRQAKAQPELTIATCVGFCASAFRNAQATTFCGACMIMAGRILSEHWLGSSQVYGYGCAKADVGC